MGLPGTRATSYRPAALTVLLSTILLSACGGPAGPVGNPDALVDTIAEEVWQHALARDVYLRVREGLPVTSIPDITLEAARLDSAFYESVLDRLEPVDAAALNDEERRVTLRMLRWDMQARVDRVEHYWLSFPVMPYTAGLPLNFTHQAFAEASLVTADEREAYLGLVDEYGDWLDQAVAKLAGQRERGILIPQPALPGVRGLLAAFRESAPALLGVAGREGTDPASAPGFADTVARRVDRRVAAGYAALLDFLGDAYEHAAPASVGLGQYPGGKDYYRMLAQLYTTSELTPKEIFDYGKRRVDAINAEMQRIRDQVGFTGTQPDFHAMLRSDARFLARTPADVEARFDHYIARIEPLIDDWFSLMPKAPYGVLRLDAEQEGSMTFGFYDAPNPARPQGNYRYNGSNLESRSLVVAGALIYHELIPGHHFHIALQSENPTLPAYRRVGAALWLSAFTEGWAEYAAEVAGEMGLYDDPYDRYGRLLMDAFLSSRLVVDPGMNGFGWSLEKARQYLRDHTFLSELEIATETLRYSTDIPGQALAYKIGQRRIEELRAHAEETLGDAFDVREFHAAAVGSGAMPLTVLEQHIDWYIEQEED